MVTIERSSGREPVVETFRVLGVGVSAVQIPGAIRILEHWIGARQRPRFVAVTGMHGVMEAQHDPDFKRVLDAADLVVPDGMPLVWLGRRRGHALARRVYGPELMETFCRETGGRYRHFLYGGSEATVERLKSELETRFGVSVAGAYSPPFRALSAEEEEEVVSMINASEADVLWVGLSTPKQERWMERFRERLNVPALLGVGAAFDFLAGQKSSAPRWMQENGLEWLYRLTTEPRRLWRRYLVLGSEFVLRALREELGRSRAPRVDTARPGAGE